MPRRKRSTWGSVTNLGGGTYRLRWLEDTPEGRKRRSETIRNTTRKKADHRLAEIRLSVRESPTPTVEEIWRRYVLPGYKADLEAKRKALRTVDTYMNVWEHVVKPRWSHVPVGKLRAIDVQEWMLTLAGGTARPALVVLRAISSAAELREDLSVDPLRRAFKMPAAKEGDRTVPNLAGLGRLWKVCRGSWPEAAFLLCAHAGLRVGEACGVRPDDFEWREERTGLVAVVNVERQVSTKQKVCPPKFNSYRTAVLTDPWASRMRELIAALRPGAVYVMDDGASDPERTPRRRRIAQQWTDLIKGTEFEGMPLQRMRPAYETYMHWELGVRQEKLSKLMGHKTMATTQRHYDRPDTDELVALVVDASTAKATVSG